MNQMNIRIDESLKKQGDKVFSQHNLTPSAVVRAVWQYAAETGEIPEFIYNKDQKYDQEKAKKLELVDNGFGLVARSLGISLPLIDNLSDEALRDLVYQEKLNEYE